VSLTEDGRSLASSVATDFERDVSTMLSGLPPGDRDTLTTVVSRLLDRYASAHGVDLFATVIS
jgi:hypothetical protein